MIVRNLNITTLFPEVTPFSFVYGGTSTVSILPSWKKEVQAENIDATRKKETTVWNDLRTGMRIICEALTFSEFPATEWVLYFENAGIKDTPLIESIRVLDITYAEPVCEWMPYVLHRTSGAPANETDFTPHTVTITAGDTAMLGGEHGRSSSRDFPFFDIESGDGFSIIAVGWTGQWLAELACYGKNYLRVTAGMEHTHFILHPGERVRSPRILFLQKQGTRIDTLNNFRQLIHRHYASPHRKERRPFLFCNTCFTREGGWLNKCNAENQISLIRALAPLNVEAVITDAGWFEGGWPDGAGNLSVRKDAYPEGIKPVAAAARDSGTRYGLWFEPERAMNDTEMTVNHPQWLLHDKTANNPASLVNFGLKEVQQYFLRKLAEFMDLPGFSVYRQDFNMYPLSYWLANDDENRRGITEIRYIEGLYEYWDEIRRRWPECIMDGCSSGGRRIDLETIRRFDFHQESDYWFNNEVDQTRIYGLSQYLPNYLFTTPLSRLDDYSFHSCLATSLCLGWIADAPDFDMERAKKITGKYRQIRHLLTGDWYPLLPFSGNAGSWLAMQFHRPDLQEGVILVFRRAGGADNTVKLSPCCLLPDAHYTISYDTRAVTERKQGAELMKDLSVTLIKKPASELIIYKSENHPLSVSSQK